MHTNHVIFSYVAIESLLSWNRRLGVPPFKRRLLKMGCMESVIWSRMVWIKWTMCVMMIVSDQYMIIYFLSSFLEEIKWTQVKLSCSFCLWSPPTYKYQNSFYVKQTTGNLCVKYYRPFPNNACKVTSLGILEFMNHMQNINGVTPKKALQLFWSPFDIFQISLSMLYLAYNLVEGKWSLVYLLNHLILWMRVVKLKHFLLGSHNLCYGYKCIIYSAGE